MRVKPIDKDVKNVLGEEYREVIDEKIMLQNNMIKLKYINNWLNLDDFEIEKEE